MVLTRGPVAEHLSSVLAALVTTVVRNIPTEVGLNEADGMPRPCVVNLDNLATVPAVFLTERATRLGPDRMHEVCLALAHATGC